MCNYCGYRLTGPGTVGAKMLLVSSVKGCLG